MTIKVNAQIELVSMKDIIIAEIWDVDVLIDDKISSQTVSKSGPIEFILNSSKTGEIKPDLQLRLFSSSGEELYRSPIDDSINILSRDENTGFIEHTTIDFGKINL